MGDLTADFKALMVSVEEALEEAVTAYDALVRSEYEGTSLLAEELARVDKARALLARIREEFDV